MLIMGCRGAGFYDFKRDGRTLSFVRHGEGQTVGCAGFLLRP